MKIPHDAKVEKAASKDDMRRPLMAAFLDLEEKEKPVLVATDGKILAVVPVDVQPDDKAGHVSANALKAARSKENLDTILLNGEEKLLSCVFPRFDLGQFPKWRMIDKPIDKPALTVTIDVDLLKRLADALGGERVTLRFWGTDKSEYLESIDVAGPCGHGKLMPLRGPFERK